MIDQLTYYAIVREFELQLHTAGLGDYFFSVGVLEKGN